MSPFGREGPYSGWAASELTLQALSGYLSLNGQAGRPPLKAPGHILAYACGVSALVAVLAGLVKRVRRGCGSLIECSELEALTSMTPLLRGQYTGLHASRGGGPGTGVRSARRAAALRARWEGGGTRRRAHGVPGATHPRTSGP
jgi:crotonobetainyl-CoA:carnitine CoA-transferase CaiB-like acyl-CoA transferase